MIARHLRAAMRRHSEGADLSKLVRLPGWVDALISHDRVAYRLHLIVGEVLNRLDAPPSVVGLEWLKAAAHAGSEPALERVAAGLAATRRRASSPDFDAQIGAAVVRRVTSGGRDVTMRRRQLVVLEWAGMSVPTPDARVGRLDQVSES